jgi:hypothetical protein
MTCPNSPGCGIFAAEQTTRIGLPAVVLCIRLQLVWADLLFESCPGWQRELFWLELF